MESLLPKIKMDLVKVSEKEIVFSLSSQGRPLALIEASKRRINSRKIKIYVYIAEMGKLFKNECKLDESVYNCVEESLAEPLSLIKLTSSIETVAKALADTVRKWEDIVEAERLARMREALGSASEPRMVIQTENGFIEVLAGDGVEIPEYGGFIDLGDCLAISETTYAYVRVQGGTGGEELTRIEPVGFLAVYRRTPSGLELVEVKAYAPRHVESVEACGHPVRIRKTAATAVAGHYSFASLEVLDKARRAVAGSLVIPNWANIGKVVVERLRESIYLPDERKYYVMAAYILMTYFYDVFTAIPFLWLYGPYGSGKTRANMTATFMSRRGVMILNPSDASLYRLSDAVGATIGIDESALTDNQALIIAGSYKKGAAVPRAEVTRHGIVLKLFESVVPRIFSFKDLPKEDYLLQRIIGVQMEKGRPKKKEDPLPIEYREIRDTLYLLRLLGLSQILDAKKKAGEILDACELEGREREIWWPLLTAAILGGFEDRVLDYMAEDLEKRLKSEDIYVEEKTVLAAIEEFFKEIEDIEGRKKRIALFMTRDLQNKILRRTLEEESCFDITEKSGGEEIEVIKPECRKRAEELRRKWSPQKIGKVLERLGFNEYRKAEGKGAAKRRYYRLPWDVFEKKAKLYGYFEGEGSAESVKSVKCLRDILQKIKSERLALSDDLEHDEEGEEDDFVKSRIPPRNLTDSADLTDPRGLEVFLDDA